MRKTIFIITLIVVVVLSAWFYWKYSYTYSDGNRTGLLQKFSHKGNLFKTYEGELVLSSIAGTNNTPLSSEKFYFSVADDSIAKQLMNYEGQRVTLHYEEKKGTLMWRGDTRYMVDKVKTGQ